MARAIADTLVLVVPRDSSLARRAALGVLERDWALTSRLAEGYNRFVIVSAGGPFEPDAVAHMAPDPHVICKDRCMSASVYAEHAGRAVADLLAGTCTAVVRTEQFTAARLAIGVTEALRSRGIHTALLARGTYLPSRFAAHEHGAHSARARTLGLMEGCLVTRADGLIGSNGKMVDDLCWRHGIPKYRTATVPSFVLPATRSAELAEAEPREPHTVLYAGPLIARKRVDILIRAAESVRRESGIDLQLEIVGRGSRKRDLQEQAARLGVPARFIAAMPHHRLLERMRTCAFFADASEVESHPRLVLEAMSEGACAVVAASPGLISVVRHGVTGFCVESSPEGFSRLLRGLIEDDELVGMIGSAAAVAVREAFGLDAAVELELDAHRRAMIGQRRTIRRPANAA